MRFCSYKHTRGPAWIMPHLSVASSGRLRGAPTQGRKLSALGCSLKPFHGQEPNHICPAVSLEKPLSTQLGTRFSFPYRASITSGVEPNNGPIPSAKVG
jgi:hypothetical protein